MLFMDSFSYKKKDVGGSIYGAGKRFGQGIFISIIFFLSSKLKAQFLQVWPINFAPVYATMSSKDL